MPPIAHPTAEDRQWRRRRKGRSRTGAPLHALRIRDLEIIIRNRWGATLPDDDSGRDDALIVLHHMVNYAVDPHGRMVAWLAARCPWMAAEEAAQTIDRVLASPRRFKADTLAAKLNLIAADRARWGITTIGAVDLPKEKRLARRRARDRERKEHKRRTAGARPRAEYLASIKSAEPKPWQAAGMSRAAWYRRQRETGSGGSTCSQYAADAPCPT